MTNKSLVLFCCVHIGERAHDADELQKYINWIARNKKSVSWAGLGDLIDVGVPVGTRHVGSVFNNNITPQQQLETFCQKFKCIAGQGLAMVTGNHERRVESVTSIELLKMAADRLNMPYKGNSGILIWQGKKIFIAHGASSGPMTDYNKIMNAYEGLDAIVLGHTHQMYTQKLRRFTVNAQGNIGEKEIHLIRAGSFLKDAVYAKAALHPPTPIGAPILEIDENGKLNVRLGL